MPQVWRQDLPVLALLGMLHLAVFPLTSNGGLRLTEAFRGSLVRGTVPVLSAVRARTAGREDLILRQVVGQVLSLQAVAVVGAVRGPHWQGNKAPLVGTDCL